MGVPKNGWLIMENLIKMDDLWYPHFQEPPHNDQILSAMWMIKNTYYIPVSLIPRFSKIITPIRSLFTLICEQNDESLLWTDFLPYIPIINDYLWSILLLLWIIIIIYESTVHSICFSHPCHPIHVLRPVPGSRGSSGSSLAFCEKNSQGAPSGVQQSHHAPSASTTPPIHWIDTVYGYSMGWLMLCLQEWFVIGDTWIYI